MQFASIAGLAILGAALALAGWSVAGRIARWRSRRHEAAARDADVPLPGSDDTPDGASEPDDPPPPLPTLTDIVARLDVVAASICTVAEAQATLIDAGATRDQPDISARLDAADARLATLAGEFGDRLAAGLDAVPATLAEALTEAEAGIADTVAGRIPAPPDLTGLEIKIDAIGAALVRQQAAMEARLDGIAGTMDAARNTQKALIASLETNENRQVDPAPYDGLEASMVAIAEGQAQVLRAIGHTDAAVTTIASGLAETAPAKERNAAIGSTELAALRGELAVLREQVRKLQARGEPASCDIAGEKEGTVRPKSGAHSALMMTQEKKTLDDADPCAGQDQVPPCFAPAQHHGNASATTEHPVKEKSVSETPAADSRVTDEV